MAFALDPKFVIEEMGAVGIENCFYVTKTGIERITPYSDTLRIL